GVKKKTGRHPHSVTITLGGRDAFAMNARCAALAIDNCRAAAAKRPRHADDEPEIVPTTAVVCLVDPHVGSEQADEKRYRRNEPVPKAGTEAGGHCSWDLESRAWSRYRQDIGHLHLTTRRWCLTPSK